MRTSGGDNYCSVLEDLYFGDVQCHLSHVDGQSFSVVAGQTIKPGQFSDMVDEESGITVGNIKNSVNQYLEPCVFLGREYENLIMPAVPGLPMQVSNDTQEMKHTLFHKPLIKDEHGSIVGVQSGVRSALVKDISQTAKSDNWMRLKGCGNNYHRFPLHNVNHKAQYAHCVNIRGCSFETTCFRELYFSEKINQLLHQMNRPLGNEPIGWFEYQEDSDCLPVVKRLCSIFETPGDKRLNDHLLVGLETLLQFVSFDSSDLALLVSPARRSDDQDNYIESTWWTVLKNESVGVSFTDFIDTYRLKIDLGSSQPELNHMIPSKYSQLWYRCLQQLDDTKLISDVDSPGNLFSYLYWRLGREVGEIQKLLLDNEISWGTYSDQLGDHCNAHPNNFVILPPSDNNHNCFLAPVDFDMAYSKQEFTREENLWKQWRDQEKQALLMELAGAMLSTGLKELVQYENVSTDNLRWSLRDTMVLAYLDALHGVKDKHPVKPELDDGVHALIQMALILTSSNIA